MYTGPRAAASIAFFATAASVWCYRSCAGPVRNIAQRYLSTGKERRVELFKKLSLDKIQICIINVIHC